MARLARAGARRRGELARRVAGLAHHRAGQGAARLTALDVREQVVADGVVQVRFHGAAPASAV